MLATPTVSEIEVEREHVLAFRVSGPVRAPDLGAMAAVIGDAVEADGEMSLILVLEGAGLEEGLADVTPEAVVAGGRADWRLARFAIVGEPDAVAAIAEVLAPLTGTRPRKFVTEDVSAAWAFVGALPAGTPAGGFGQATL